MKRKAVGVDKLLGLGVVRIAVVIENFVRRAAAHLYGHREYAADTATLYVYTAFVLALIELRYKVRGAGCKAGVFVGKKVVDVYDSQIVYARGNVPLYHGHIVLQGSVKTTFVKPYANAYLGLTHDYYGVEFGGFEARSHIHRHCKRSSRARRHKVCKVAHPHDIGGIYALLPLDIQIAHRRVHRSERVHKRVFIVARVAAPFLGIPPGL